jgi:hypothetical protein
MGYGARTRCQPAQNDIDVVLYQQQEKDMNKPEYNFTFTVGANQILTKRYTRKELAQALKGFRAQPTRYSVCKNENAIVVEMLPVMAVRAIAIYVRCYA